MKHLFVSYELALKLKEKGFDESCFAFYNKFGLCRYMDSDKDWNSVFSQCLKNSDITIPDSYTAPLYQQVIDWLREKHSIWIEIILHADETKNYIQAFVINYKKDDWESFEKAISHPDNPSHSPTCFNTTKYYIALETAIEKALKLI